MDRVSVENLEKARFERGPMAGKALSYTVGRAANMTPVAGIIPRALRETAKEFLNPPLKCFRYLGIQKLAGEMPGWLECAPDPGTDLLEQADMMENSGTGGAVFRNFFGDYLYEALEYYPRNTKLSEGAELYRQAADLWSGIADLIKKAGKSGEQNYLQQASEKCMLASVIEKKAMENFISIL
ncbi:MAG: DUF4872 domain-containing protein [Spirochaetales bacterium]|nr:DUF4872 domain-containing protein [Spirochaetales bacterium]